jgi:hypothetical protein
MPTRSSILCVCSCCVRSRFVFWAWVSRHRCIDTTAASRRRTFFPRCRVYPRPQPCPRTRSRHRQSPRRNRRQMHRPLCTACARRLQRRGSCWAASPPRTRSPLPLPPLPPPHALPQHNMDLQALKRLGLTPAEFSVFGSSSGGKVAALRCGIDRSHLLAQAFRTLGVHTDPTSPKIRSRTPPPRTLAQGASTHSASPRLSGQLCCRDDA